MVHTIKVNGGIIPEEVEFIFDRIKKRAVGAVWIQWGAWKWEECLKRVLETADYPILIMTDAEKGMGDYLIGHHNQHFKAQRDHGKYPPVDTERFEKAPVRFPQVFIVQHKKQEQTDNNAHIYKQIFAKSEIVDQIHECYNSCVKIDPQPKVKENLGNSVF
jgi:hypothetical protein